MIVSVRPVEPCPGWVHRGKNMPLTCGEALRPRGDPEENRSRKGFLNLVRRQAGRQASDRLQFGQDRCPTGGRQAEAGRGPVTTRTGKRPAQRAVTLTEVARLAGVSVATASKALNGRQQVRAETRARVVEAAERLSFSPNALARSLLAGRTGTVGLLTSDLEGRFSIPILMGAEDAFGSGKTSVFLCDAREDTIREQYHLSLIHISEPTRLGMISYA